MAKYHGIDLLFNEEDSRIDTVKDMKRANVLRIVGEIIEIANNTGGNLLEMLALKFSMDQDALQICDDILQIGD